MDLQPPVPDGHPHGADEWAETLARTVAHLAAQLTMAQLRLRALATELSAAGAVDADRVAAHLGELAQGEAGAYLRENLGASLVDLIDVETLEAEIVDFLQP
jgi:hypothetical protein